MKALKYILYGLVIAAAAGLLAYQGLVTKTLDSSNLTKGILIIVGALIGMLKPRKNRTVSNKKATYQSAYSEHIQNAFFDEPKLEKQFYNAVHDYNCSRPAAAIAKLEKLRKQCQRSADLRAVTVFMGLCYDDMGLYTKAIEQYTAALHIRPNSSLYSNMGLCHHRSGQPEKAEECYRNAIALDPKNAFAHNNLATHYFRQGDYETALKCAEDAIAVNSHMPQALSCAAICCALLDDQEGYEKYYRQAVANGYDGHKIKNAIDALNPNT